MPATLPMIARTLPAPGKRAALRPPGPAEEWAQAHANFHNTLLSGCNSRRLIDIAAQLRDGSELYRRWSHALAHDYERDVPSEHRSMLKAVLERNQEQAEEALAAHIRHTTDVLLHDVEAEST